VLQYEGLFRIQPLQSQGGLEHIHCLGQVIKPTVHVFCVITKHIILCQLNGSIVTQTSLYFPSS